MIRSKRPVSCDRLNDSSLRSVKGREKACRQSDEHGNCFKGTGEETSVGAQELCESEGGRPGLPVPNSPYCLSERRATVSERHC